MIRLKYTGAEDQTVSILIHAKIIIGYDISNGFIQINFSHTPDAGKDKKPTTFNWSFRTFVAKVHNFTEVEAFLKTIKQPEIKKPAQPGQTQTEIAF